MIINLYARQKTTINPGFVLHMVSGVFRTSKQWMNLIWGRRDTILAFIQADVHGRGWLDPHEAIRWVGRLDI